MTGETIIKEAKKWLGYNGKKFCADYGMPFGQDWCCAYVWDVFRMAGASKLFCGGMKTAYVPTVQEWCALNLKRVSLAKAKAGDIIIMTWGGGRRDHIGLITKKGTKDAAYTIEGNTGNAINTKTKVMERVRPKSQVYAIYRPKYEENKMTKGSAKNIVNLARKQIGNGRRKYCEAYGKDNSWCNIFVWWLYGKEGYKLKKTTYARREAKWIKKKWKHISMEDAKAGDIVFFTNTMKGNNKMKGKVSHVGVIRRKGTTKKCYTIEGNVGNKDWKKSIVDTRERGIKYVWGIFRPPYPINYPVLPKKGYLDKNNKGVQVKRLQRNLRRLGYKYVIVNGKFDENTEKAVNAYKAKYKMGRKGKFGKKALKMMKKEIGETIY